MASIQWDHIVHYVNDLEAAMEKFRKQGLVAFVGGSHKQWGTYNALSYFELCYVEFLSVEDWAVAKAFAEPNVLVHDAVKLLPEREELSRVALRTDDIEGVREHLLSFDLDLSPIMDGKRLDAQGNLIEWKMMTIAGDYHGLPYPFVIQWKGADEERRDRMVESGVIQEHPAGDVSVEAAIFFVSDPWAVAERWEEMFGFELVRNGSATDEVKLKVEEQTFVFKKGEENRMSTVVFQVEENELKGTIFKIGQGEYLFR